MKYKFVISGRLNNLNDYTNACRTHRQKGNNMKRKNAQKVLQVIYEQLPRVRIEKPVTVTYTWYEKDRRRDLDNISSFDRKVIQDALVKAGVLRNDGWKEIRGFSDRFAVDAENPRIEVEIEETE